MSDPIREIRQSMAVLELLDALGRLDTVNLTAATRFVEEQLQLLERRLDGSVTVPVMTFASVAARAKQGSGRFSVIEGGRHG